MNNNISKEKLIALQSGFDFGIEVMTRISILETKVESLKTQLNTCPVSNKEWTEGFIHGIKQGVDSLKSLLK